MKKNSSDKVKAALIEFYLTLRQCSLDIKHIKTDTINLGDSSKVNISKEKNSNNFYFFTSPMTLSSFALDKYGDVRWYMETYLHDIQVLENNHLLIGTNSFITLDLSTDIYEIDFLGRKYTKYEIISRK